MQGRYQWKVFGVFMGTTFAMLVGIAAEAAVVDEFQCRIRYADVNGALQFDSNFTGSVVRRTAATAPETEITEATVGASNRGPMGSMASLTIHYRHAVRYKNGEARRAVQATAASFCLRSRSDHGICGDARIRCTEEGRDPFDPECGWKEVPIVGGVLQFDTESLPPFEHELDGEFSLGCEHVGTHP
ncbi:MAG TPA: hypothetical protein VM598_14640 [Bdellovibrionota bacterium]|nr:hypothetical protein [Bdellovibrionota bacterium]